MLVVGAGGLGSPVLYYLTAAGVGQIHIIDSDVIDMTNLQRQILYTEADLEKTKAGQAQNRLMSLNSEIRITSEVRKFGEGPEDLSSYNLIIEATDTFKSKFTINDRAVEAGIPLVMASVIGFEGHVMAIKPGETACYRCIFGEEPDEAVVPPASTLGILGSSAGVVGALEASEALKILTGVGTTLFGKMIQVDLAESRIRTIQLPRNHQCPVCGGR